MAFLLVAGFVQAGGLKGSYTIDPSSSASATNYTSFSDAASDLISGTRSAGTVNGPGVTGAVVFKVSNGSYNEQVEFSAITGATSTNTITFTSASGDSSQVILYDGTSHSSTANYTLHITGASYLTFNKITIQSTASSGNSGVIQMDALAEFNTISHCQIIGVASTYTGYNDALILTGSGYDQVNYNYFNSNLMRRGSCGFYFLSNPTTQSDFSVGNTIVKNIIDSVYYAGIQILSGDSTIITGNSIFVKGSSGGYGINYNNQYGFFGTLYSTGQFSRNKIIMPDGGYGMNLNYVTGGSSYTDTVSNNFVSVGGASEFGIYAYFCDYINFYYNNLLIYGIQASSASTPSALEIPNFNSVVNSCDVYNNNLINLRSGTSYALYAWSNSSKSVKNEDYNNMYSPNSQFLLNYYYINYKDLATWKLNTYGLAAHDTTVDPYFVSTSDLHVSNIALNAAATPISGITTDIDGQLRDATTPDIGADEFRPLLYDAGIISIDSPSTGFCTGSRDVYAKLLNFGTGTITSATIDWSVNGTPKTSVSWTGSIASGAGTDVKLGNFSFSSGTNYTVKVTSSNPNSVVDSNSSNDSKSIILTPGLIGTFLISNSGGSPDYTSISAAASDLVLKGVCGAVTMNIADGSYNEHVSLYTIGGASNSKRITFESKSHDSTKVTIDTAYTYTGVPTSTISLTGASYITFKYLTVTAGLTTGFDFYKNVFQLNGGSAFDSISNNLIYGVNSSSNLYGNGVSSPGDVDSFLTVSHNGIKYGSYGIMLTGVQGVSFYTGTEPGNVVAYNTIDSVSQGGVSMQYCVAPLIYNNTLTNLQYSIYGGTFAGVYLYFTSGATQIYNNKFDLQGGGTGISTEYAIGDVNDTARFYNNFISAEGSSSPLYSSGTFGIDLEYSGYILAAYNSINITNTSTTAGILTNHYTTPNYFIYDNNVVNTGGGYAVSYTGTTPSYSDYNNFYVPKANTLGNYAGTAAPALSDWQTASSLDANSISITPLFKSTTDLHAQNTGLQAGIPLGIKTDIDGDKRGATPMIGADEFIPVANDAGVISIDSPYVPFCVGTKDIYVRINNFGTNSISSIDVNYSINGGAFSTTSLTISPALAVKKDMLVKLTSHSFTVGTATSIIAYTSSPNGTTDGNVHNDSSGETITPAISGTYVIDPSGGGAFTSFTNAVAALSAGGVCGAVVINAMDGSYSETIDIGPIAGTSSKSTITFESKSLDSSKVILDYTGSGSSTSSMNPTVALSGCKWVTFQKMTVSHSSGSDYCPAFYLRNGASHNTFKNNVILGPNGSGYTYITSGLYFSADPNNYNLVDNNNIRDASDGIFIDLNNNYSTNNIVSNNWIDSCYAYGIKSWFTDSFVAYKNVITNLSSSSAIGIDLYFDNYGYEVTMNKVDLPNGGTGIHSNFDNVNGTYAAFLDIENNFVSVGGSNPSTGIFSQYDNGLTCYQNNVNMYNTDTTCVAGNFQSVGGIRITTDIENNVFADSLGYALSTDGAGYPSGDYNDLYTYSGNTGNYAGTICKTLSDWQTNSSMDANSVTCNPLYTSDVDLHVKGSCLNNAGAALGVILDIDGQTRSTTTPDIGADEFSLSNDIGAKSILSPVSPSCGSSSTTVGVIVHNYGTSGVSGYKVTVNVTGAATASASTSPSKTLGSTDDTVYVSFPSLNTTAGGTYIFQADAIVTPDANPANDTTSKISILFLKAPKAGFSAITPVCSGTASNVTDKSVVDPKATVSYKYYLVNASGTKVDSSTSASPSFTPAAGGVYRVRQTIKYSAGCSDTSSEAVVVNASPVVNFSYKHHCLNDTTVFTNTSTAGSGSITSQSWSFGNGDTSNLVNPKEIYKAIGAETVKLTVRNSNGCSTTGSTSLSIDSVDAKFSVSIAVDGTASFTPKDASLTKYAWNFGDTSGTSTLTSPTYKYKPGARVAMLTVTDSIGCHNFSTDSVIYLPTGIESMIAGMTVNVFPNPFNNELHIAYNMSTSNHVTIRVNDIMGRTVATLTDSKQEAGTYTLSVNSDDYNALNTSGIYFLKMTVGDKSATYKLIRTK